MVRKPVEEEEFEYEEEPDAPETEESEDEPEGLVRSGWGGYKDVRASLPSLFPEELKLEDEPSLIKFLEGEPFAAYRMHWLQSITKGKKSYVCLEDDCPLCNIGDKELRLSVCFNVALLSEKSKPLKRPANKVLLAGVRLVGQLEALAQDAKTGPLTKGYWAITKTGEKQSTSYNLAPVKERDLREDWGVNPIDEDGKDALMKGLYDTASIQVTPRSELAQIAKALSEG